MSQPLEPRNPHPTNAAPTAEAGGNGAKNSAYDAPSRPQGASANREGLEQAVCTKAEADFRALVREAKDSPIPKEVRDQLESSMDQDYGPFQAFRRSVDIRIETLLLPLVKDRIRLEAGLRKEYRMSFSTQRTEDIKPTSNPRTRDGGVA